VGDDPVRFGVRADVIAYLAGARQFGGGGTGEVNRLYADLVGLRPAGSKWAHGQ
jgi:hypothetical protein